MLIGYLLLGLAIAGLVYGYLSNFVLRSKRFSVTFKTGYPTSPIILLSDLHGCSFGFNNQRLLKKIKSENPAFILISGDMVVKNGKGIDTCLALMTELVAICSVYYAPGNHEIRLECYEEFKSQLQNIGVNYLENQSTLWNSQLSIVGLDLPLEHYKKIWEKDKLTQEEFSTIISKPSKEYPQILVAHTPEYFPLYEKWGADLVVSGHLHGGIMTLPFGGVIAPSYRLFPKYCHGKYQSNQSTLIVSKGLGLHHIKLRFFNYPEIVVLEFDQK